MSSVQRSINGLKVFPRPFCDFATWSTLNVWRLALKSFPQVFLRANSQLSVVVLLALYVGLAFGQCTGQCVCVCVCLI